MGGAQVRRVELTAPLPPLRRSPHQVRSSGGFRRLAVYTYTYLCLSEQQLGGADVGAARAFDRKATAWGAAGPEPPEDPPRQGKDLTLPIPHPPSLSQHWIPIPRMLFSHLHAHSFVRRARRPLAIHRECQSRCARTCLSFPPPPHTIHHAPRCSIVFHTLTCCHHTLAPHQHAASSHHSHGALRLRHISRTRCAILL